MFFRKKKKLEAPQNAVIYPPAFNDDPPSLQITTDYADNKIFSRELHLSLSGRDWCEFVKQDFYPQLIEWVRHLENVEIPRNIEPPDNLKD